MLRIALASSEFVPFAKTGGLADVAAGLSAYLASIGQDVRAFMPLYDTIDDREVEAHRYDDVQNITIDMGGRPITFSLVIARPPGCMHWVYMIDCPELYHRGHVYAPDGDEHIRFGFFSRAVLESCQRMQWAPHIVHCNDWHTALMPLYLRSIYEWDRDIFGQTKTVLTLHNLGYQGTFGADVARSLGLDGHYAMFHNDDLNDGRINFLKTGLLYADALTTVSRTYAHEIQTDEFGLGLQHILRARHEDLVGIVNGVDYSEWNPETDQRIAHRYSIHDLSGKAANRDHLCDRLGLLRAGSAPIIGMICRMTAQKGIDVMMDALPHLLNHRDARIVVLGSGETRYEDYFRGLQNAYPGRVCFYCGYNNDLSHQIEAGSDVFLMPSRFEPCGLNQMYSMKYGTVPIVRKTGGLADTVEHWDPETGRGTGFVFEHSTADGFHWALSEAMKTWPDKNAWSRLVRNGMVQDFSWHRQGRLYLALYAKLSGM